MRLLAFFASAAVACATVDSPRLGCLVHPDGSLRQVFGVRGNFIVSSSLVSDVLSFSCDGNVVLAKTPAALLAFDRTGVELARVDASAGKAIFVGLTAILDDKTAFVFNEKEKSWNRSDEHPSVAPPLPFTVRDGLFCFGETKSLPVPGEVQTITRMSADWYHVVTNQGHFALNVDRDEPEIFALPVRSSQ